MNQGRTHLLLRAAAAGWVVCMSAAAWGDSLGLYLDNDGRWFKPNHNTDRHYTSGVKLVYGFQPNWQWLEDFGKWNFPFFPVDSQETAVAAGLFIGQNIYTPDRIDEPLKRHEKDMKYAGWLYTGLFIQRAAGPVMDQLELDVGMVGPSAGRQAQNYTHRFWAIIRRLDGKNKLTTTAAHAPGCVDSGSAEYGRDRRNHGRIWRQPDAPTGKSD